VAPLVVCSGAGYLYRDGTPGLTSLDLEVEPGEIVILAGRNGSGKSTVCRLLLGLVPHLHGGSLTGRVFVDGLPVATTPPAVLSRRAALVLEDPAAQCVASTVERDLAFGPACHGLDRAEIARRVERAAADIGIGLLLERAPHTLSGGELQRVAIAGAVAVRPKLLVLDEPLAFLDDDGAARLAAILRQLAVAGLAIVVAEQDLAPLVSIASRIVVLAQGRVVASLTPGELVHHDLWAWGIEPPAPSAAGGPAAGGPAARDPAAARAPAAPSVAVSPEASPPAIAWEAVHGRRDGREVLAGASLAVAPGEAVAVVGANGSGKTTLLLHGNGLLRPSAGTVRVGGRPIGRRAVSEVAREVGFVVQQPLRMLFASTVREEIAAGPRALRRHDPAWIDELCERFELGPLLDRVPQSLSAGERRRLAIVAVLASRPAVVQLDEPTAGLDGPARRTLTALLARGLDGGAAVVAATHDGGWAARLGWRRVTLAEGRLSEVVA
jgi:energy-coupling factor transport system ATP-binding protein